jgi:hypothetical protein
MMRFYTTDTGGDYDCRRNWGLSGLARGSLHAKGAAIPKESAALVIPLNGFRVLRGTR